MAHSNMGGDRSASALRESERPSVWLRGRQQNNPPGNSAIQTNT
jgi:hypothetical protein